MPARRRAPAAPSPPDFPPGLSQPALRALAAAGIASLADVAQWSEAELLGLHGVGPKTTRVLRPALAARGLAFAAGARAADARRGGDAPTDWIAEATWIARDVAGGRVPLFVRIGRPVVSAAGEWQCALALDGLHAPLAPMRGEDAVQALGLAWQLGGRLLRAFVAGGGQLEHATGEPVSLETYFAAPEAHDA